MKNSLMILALAFCVQSWSFPIMKDWKNSPKVAFDNKKEAALKKEQLLKSPFAVVTGDKDELALKLNTFDELYIYTKTKFQVLELAENSGFVTDFYLLQGQIRYSSNYRGVDKASRAVTIHTGFFDLKVEDEADFIILLDMKEPSVEIKQISGVLPVEFFAYEKKVKLTAGQSVKFVGELMSDKQGLAYDYLLNSRKVPRGKLLDVESFDQKSFLKHEKDVELQRQKAKKAVIQKEIEKKQKQKAYEDSFLCKKPFGQLNQCVWQLTDSQCFRMRCNASGVWGDKTERPLTSLCKSEPSAADCDY